MSAQLWEADKLSRVVENWDQVISTWTSKHRTQHDGQKPVNKAQKLDPLMYLYLSPSGLCYIAFRMS